MLTTLLIANVIISVLHSIKHIPQCMHMIENETSESLSMRYIQGELFLNMLSTMTTPCCAVSIISAAIVISPRWFPS